MWKKKEKNLLQGIVLKHKLNSVTALIAQYV